MKKFNWIIVAMLALMVVFSSCSEQAPEPQNHGLLKLEYRGDGNDEDPPIILGDTTDTNP